MFNCLNRVFRSKKRIIAKPNISKKEFCKELWISFSEFAQNTSLHGIKYIGDDNRTRFERFLWTTLVLISLTICIYLLRGTYVKWINSPVIFLEDKTPQKIGSIPFPAVTICPENKINQSIYNFSESFKSFNTCRNMEEKLNISILLCEEIAGFAMATDYCEHQEMMDESISVKEFIDDISPDEEIFGITTWNGKHFNPNTEMTKTFTEDGVCFTFNGLSNEFIFNNDIILFRNFNQNNFSIKNWSIDNGYHTSKTSETYPKRVFSSGIKSGLSLMFAVNINHLDYGCRNLPEAFKLIFHHPLEIPRAEKLTKLTMTTVTVETGTEVLIRLVPKVVDTSESLKKHPPEVRGCFYPQEKKLRYFKEYSEQKCEFECIQNVTLDVCGCLAYYMPTINNVSVCRSNKVYCMLSVKEDLATMNEDNLCNCLPMCKSIIYKAETSEYTYDLLRRFQYLDMNVTHLDDYLISRVTIFFKESQYFVMKRTQLYGLNDFISDCGGLFGLFVGFSLISLIEAIYFIAKRAYVIYRKMKMEKNLTV